MIKRSIKLIIALVIALSILTLLTSQWPGVAQSQQINLIDSKHTWKPSGDTIISQNQSNLQIVVVTTHKDKINSRAFLPTQINSAMNKSLILTLDHASLSTKGNATFGAS
jgi:predicted membrane-bound spermidine synthase